MKRLLEVEKSRGRRPGLQTGHTAGPLAYRDGAHDAFSSSGSC